MKKVERMIIVLHLIDVMAIIGGFFVEKNAQVLLYQGALLCNLALLNPSLVLLEKEKYGKVRPVILGLLIFMDALLIISIIVLNILFLQ